MKTTIKHILSGLGIEFFEVDGKALLTKGRKVLELHEADAATKSSLRDFAFSCPKSANAYRQMAGPNETDQLSQCIKCMFANYDANADLTDDGKLTPEYVDCSKRHYCEFVGIGCLPSLKVAELSERENSLLPHLHLPNEKIAENLFISKNTVKSHIKSIGKKLNMTYKPEMVKWFYEKSSIN